MRLDRVVETALPGKSNAALRKQAKATIELAQEIKHREAGDRVCRDPGRRGDPLGQHDSKAVCGLDAFEQSSGEAEAFRWARCRRSKSQPGLRDPATPKGLGLSRTAP